MKEALSKVPFGPASWTLLSLLIVSFVPLIETWQATGEFPEGNAWLTAALGFGLAAIRVVQTVLPDGTPGTSDPDEIPGGTPVDEVA